MATEARKPYMDHVEHTDPISMRVDGSIPSYVNGKLVRIGPGLFKFGDHEANYPMDGMGLLHSFNIADGNVTFESRFIRSETYNQNTKEGRFVHSEFGTAASPDPKLSTFAKLKAKVTGGSGMSDNCNHNLFYWNQVNALLVVGHPFHIVDPNTLETKESVRLPEGLGVDIVAEHVQVGSDGALYLLGSHVKGRPSYHIVRIPPSGDVQSSFAKAEIMFTVPGQFKVTPTSHHGFIMTENFFVIIECPLEINILKIISKATILEAITWDPSVTTKFHVFNRKTGQALKHKIECPAILCLHKSNAYEQDDHLILDLFVFKKFATKDLFFTRKTLASDEYYASKPWTKMDINKPVRFVIPTNPEVLQAGKLGDNLVKLEGEKAQAVVSKNRIDLVDRPLTEKGEDVIQYPSINLAVDRKPYKYFYGGGYGESEFLQYGVGKFDVDSKDVKSWEAKEKQYLTEPLFIQNPEDPSEDGGVLIFTLLDYAEGDDRLIVLDAKSMSQLANVHFDGEKSSLITLPEADHGVFMPS